MRVLLTNDDGVDCYFLQCLARSLTAAGHEIAIAAPRREQSWIGAAKSRHRSVHAERVELRLGGPTWSVDGTPSDCVAIGLAHLLPAAGLPAPQVVVSGINVGFNLSLGFILASGTIGGAWEGAVHGLPAVAFSQQLSRDAFERWHATDREVTPELAATLASSSGHAARLLPRLVQDSPDDGFLVHNLNFPFPCAVSTELRLTVPARIQVKGLFGPADANGEHHFAYNDGADCSPFDHLTDWAAINAGFISHTPLDYRSLGHPAS